MNKNRMFIIVAAVLLILFSGCGNQNTQIKNDIAKEVLETPTAQGTALPTAQVTVLPSIEPEITVTPKPAETAKSASGISVTPKPTVAVNKNGIEKIYNNAYNSFLGQKYTQAIELCNQILGVDAQNYKAYNVKGIAQCFAGSFEKGMANIDKSLEIKSDYGYARFNKALAYELFGQFDKALYWYDKDLEIEEYTWSYYGKASIYGRKGDVENTVKYLKMAIKLDDNCRALAKKEKDFNPVKKSKAFIDLVNNGGE